MGAELRPESSANTAVLVGLCGLATSFLTALLLWWIEARFDFAFYTWTFWFVLPVGAFLSGIAAASGYYAGAWFFGRRPTRLLLLGIVVVSVSTFFLIHFLSFKTLQIDGEHVSAYVPFWQYLDITIRATSMNFRLGSSGNGNSTGALGSFGYVVAVLQIIGFAGGGFVAYSHLAAKPYCDRCLRYLSGKGMQIRYTEDAEGLQANAAVVLSDFAAGAFASAIALHKSLGSTAHKKGNHLRSLFDIRYCKGCGLHWIKFAVQNQSGEKWEEIPELTAARFSDTVVNL